MSSVLSRVHHEERRFYHYLGLLRVANEEFIAASEHVGNASEKEPQQLCSALFPRARHGDFGLLRDLHGLNLVASDIGVTADILRLAAEELRDTELIDFCERSVQDAHRQKVWCMTQVQDNAADSLVVPH